MRVAVDTKNLALYQGGIAGFFRPLLHEWVAQRPDIEFILVGPQFDLGDLVDRSNCRHHVVAWPDALLRPLRYPIYDNLLFPRAIRAVRPEFVFSPYHDVRLPRGVPSAMMIHDTCIGDLPCVYPARVRLYFQHMLRVNLVRAGHVLTVSEASRAAILARYPAAAGRISVVPNAVMPMFRADHAVDLPIKNDSVRLLYTGGAEYRKNVRRLLEALDVLAATGTDVRLWTTGSCDSAWKRIFSGFSEATIARVVFLGRLSPAELASHYRVADAVVYPTLCEGFGRVCIEAMEVGAPLACSDLPVLREVAGEYPVYFDPCDVDAMAAAIRSAVASGHHSPCRDPRFEPEAVTARFLALMDALLEGRQPDV